MPSMHCNHVPSYNEGVCKETQQHISHLQGYLVGVSVLGAAFCLLTMTPAANTLLWNVATPSLQTPTSSTTFMHQRLGLPQRKMLTNTHQLTPAVVRSVPTTSVVTSEPVKSSGLNGVLPVLLLSSMAVVAGMVWRLVRASPQPIQSLVQVAVPWQEALTISQFSVTGRKLENIEEDVRVLIDEVVDPSANGEAVNGIKFNGSERDLEEGGDIEDEEGDLDDEGEESPLQPKKERKKRERGEASSRVSLGIGQQGFVSIRMENVVLNYGTQEVLKNATWEVKSGERVGLVGANGGGKSSMLRMLIGEVEPSGGELVKSSPSLKLAFLRQEFYDELDQTRTLKEEMMSVFAEETKILKDLKEAQDELDKCLDDLDRMQEVLDRVQALQTEADKRGLSRLDSKVEKTIQMMGFSDTDASLLVSAFSGGWKMRIGLGKVLLQEPNILLLDEPTNHLDLETVEWLERFLQEQSLPMVIVSHDREFLNQVATKIVDCENGETTSWEGNYENFMRNKAARMKQWEAQYNAQQKFLKEAKIFINSNKMNPAKAAQVSKKEREIEAIMNDPTKLIRRPPSGGKPFVFRFPDAPRLQEEVSHIRDLTHGYQGATLFENVNLRVQPGDRIAFLGPNGAGKSTLLRLILGIEQPSGGGQAGLGHRSVIANYFEQNQANALDLTKTVLESVEELAAPEESQNNLRALLGKFLFKGDTVYKKVAALSGGEKARLALCRMMLRPANVIVLDEPTNHLDIPAKEMLEEALQHFDGTVLIVSHDRYFVSQTATTIVDIKDKKLIRYEGDYRYYMERNSHVDEKVSRRYLAGSKGIQRAKVVDFEAIQKEKAKEKLSKHFKRDGNVTAGKKDKGVKNAKRMQG